MALELFVVSARTNKRHHLLSAQAKRGALAISPAIVVLVYYSLKFIVKIIVVDLHVRTEDIVLLF